MNPIEAMARAIDPEAWEDVPVPSITRIAWKMRREDSLQVARAALTALRDNGVTANYATWPYDSYCEQPDRAFRAMLDAALTGE